MKISKLIMLIFSYMIKRNSIFQLYVDFLKAMNYPVKPVAMSSVVSTTKSTTSKSAPKSKLRWSFVSSRQVPEIGRGFKRNSFTRFNQVHMKKNPADSTNSRWIPLTLKTSDWRLEIEDGIYWVKIVQMAAAEFLKR